MKKKLALILAAAMAMTAMSVNAAAEEAASEATESYPEVNVVISGSALESDQPAVIINDRTMVPIRAIGEALGVDFEWDGETKTVTFSQGSVSAALVIGETTLTVTAAGVSAEVELDSPAVIVNERTLVPVRFISENFGAEVDWDSDTKTVTITPAAEEEAVEEEVVEEAEEIDADALAEAKDLMDKAEACQDFLYDYITEMTEDQEADYDDYNDSLKTMAEVLEGEYTNEDVQDVILVATAAILDYTDLAIELGVYDDLAAAVDIEAISLDIEVEDDDVTAEDDEDLDTEDVEFTVEEVEAVYDLVAEHSSLLAAVDMSDTQQEVYDELSASLEEIKDSMDSLETQDEMGDALDTLNDINNSLADLAEELDIEF
ncbi:MAG: copper amine oxidase N-terminal domain-containing protein [Clostridiales bacterium]|nr:copper amine oxidase N-terminal domain-containing protein [Clostridiales bacterium]